jgi:hypothetical protein
MRGLTPFFVLLGAGTPVEREHEALHLIEGARSHEHGMLATADDAFQVAAEVAFLKVCVITALPDDNEVGIAFVFGDFVAQLSVPLIGDHIGDADLLEVRGGILLIGICFSAA